MDFVDRLKVEHGELVERMNALAAFIGTDKFNELSIDDQTDLRVQLTYMQGYAGVTAKRLNRYVTAQLRGT